MNIIKQEFLTGERALFNSKDMKIEDCIFADGESPLKESNNVSINQSIFKWKYPLWYCKKVVLNNTTLLQTARSGIWYSDDIEIQDSVIEAPKAFRRSSNIRLDNVNMPNALESFWNCKQIELNKVTIKGDYFALNSNDIYASDLYIAGNYAFDGCKDVEIDYAKLISKDAFWNCENVTVSNSTIIGEYIGWNSKNITFINCTIESEQGLCYMDNVKLIDCKLINTNLAFEYSSVEATITSHIDSIKNPLSGIIVANSIGEKILEETIINPNNTTIRVAKMNSSISCKENCFV